MRNLFFACIAIVVVMSSCAANASKETVESQPVNKQEVVLENILNRRSIRSYKPDQLPKSVIDTLMLAAINAPSANNKQPWEIRVVQNAEVLSKMNALRENIFHNSPTVIVIANDVKNPSSPLDCGILTQTILLSAESMGLGTCSLGGLARMLNTPEAADITKALNLPADYQPILAISLGYKNETPDAKPRDTAKVQYVD